MLPPDIVTDRYYSNGAYGRAWGVRLVREIATDPDSGLVMVSFKGVAGRCRRQAGTCPLAEFAAWARYQVALNENSWQRIGAPASEPE
jgi:hypothetical protein